MSLEKVVALYDAHKGLAPYGVSITARPDLHFTDTPDQVLKSPAFQSVVSRLGGVSFAAGLLHSYLESGYGGAVLSMPLPLDAKGLARAFTLTYADQSSSVVRDSDALGSLLQLVLDGYAPWAARQ